MYKWFRRIGTAALLLLWALAGLQLLAGKHELRETAVSEAFARVGESDKEGIVEYYGQLAPKHHLLSLEKREEYLRQIAEKLGIVDDIVISRNYGEDSQTTVLTKDGAHADTSLRLVTWRENGEMDRQTLLTHISLDGDLEMALRVRRKLKDIVDGDMETERSSASVTGTYAGELSLEQRNEIADGLLQEIDARIVTENRDMQLYTIYGYTPYLQDAVKQGRKTVNVNIAMYYNKTEGKTYVYGAVPIVGIDFREQ